MSDDKRPPPQNTTQAAGRVAEDIIGGLTHQPMLLALVLLNIIGIGAALWFLSQIAEASNARWEVLFRACIPQTDAARALLGDF